MSRLVILAAVFLLGCVLTTMFQSTSTTACTPVPMPTGEQIYPI
jgi:hypothetical protein